MNPTDQEKICISCEGRIPLNEEHCPYCGTDQTKSKMENSFQTPIFQNQSLEESLTSLYTPPYQGKRPKFEQEKEVEEHYYTEVTEKVETNSFISPEEEEEEVREVENKGKLWPIVALLFGVNLLILGLMQLIFSKGGVLRLEWSASYWFIWALLGGALGYFGYKRV